MTKIMNEKKYDTHLVYVLNESISTGAYWMVDKILAYENYVNILTQRDLCDISPLDTALRSCDKQIMDIMKKHIEKNNIIKTFMDKYQMLFLISSIEDAINEEYTLSYILDVFIKPLYNDQTVTELIKILDDKIN